MLSAWLLAVHASIENMDINNSRHCQIVGVKQLETGSVFIVMPVIDSISVKGIK